MAIIRKAIPPRAFLERLLSYDPSLGVLAWKKRDDAFAEEYGWSPKFLQSWNAHYGDRPVLGKNNRGYVCVHIQGEKYMAHRVIWKMVTGKDPDHIDHINGDKSDNRIANLRDVDAVDNQKNRRRNSNNASGYTGVFWCNTNRKWVAAITIAGRRKIIGRFLNIEQAVAVRKQAEKDLCYHPNHGKLAAAERFPQSSAAVSQ